MTVDLCHPFTRDMFFIHSICALSGRSNHTPLYVNLKESRIGRHIFNHVEHAEVQHTKRQAT